MFEGMKVVAKGDLLAGAFAAAVLGGAIATLAIEQLGRYQEQQRAERARVQPQRAPVIERRSATETVVLIHLPIEGGPQRTCRLVMNHRSQTWSLAC